VARFLQVIGQKKGASHPQSTKRQAGLARVGYPGSVIPHGLSGMGYPGWVILAWVLPGGLSWVGYSA